MINLIGVSTGSPMFPALLPNNYITVLRNY